MQLWYEIEDDRTGESVKIQAPYFSTRQQILLLAERELARRRKIKRPFIEIAEFISREMEKL